MPEIIKNWPMFHGAIQKTKVAPFAAIISGQFGNILNSRSQRCS